MVKKQKIGKVTHFYPKISVAVVELSKPLKKGDKISIEGRGNVVEQVVESMQIEHKAIEKAKAKEAIGMKTTQPVKDGDVVYKVAE